MKSLENTGESCEAVEVVETLSFDRVPQPDRPRETEEEGTWNRLVGIGQVRSLARSDEVEAWTFDEYSCIFTSSQQRARRLASTYHFGDIEDADRVLTKLVIALQWQLSTDASLNTDTCSELSSVLKARKCLSKTIKLLRPREVTFHNVRRSLGLEKLSRMQGNESYHNIRKGIYDIAKQSDDIDQ